MNKFYKVKLIKDIIEYSGSNLLVLKESPIMGITGPVMIPNKEIYRNDELGEYYIVFDEVSIVNLRNKFHKNNYCNNTNINHTSLKLDSVKMYDSYIIDEFNRKNLPKEFIDLPNGTWMVTYSISNKNDYDYLIKNGLTGFSIELNISKKQQDEIMKMNFNRQPKSNNEDDIIDNTNKISDNFINILIPLISVLLNFKLMFVPILLTSINLLIGYIFSILKINYNNKLYYIIYGLNILNILLFIVLIIKYSVKISII
jgi:hypothetical protein